MSDYGQAHKDLRAYWLTQLKGGVTIQCSRCGHPVLPTDAWDLDHTDDRRGYLGPAHASCNRAAGAAKGNRLRKRTKVTKNVQPKSRNWQPGTI